MNKRRFKGKISNPLKGEPIKAPLEVFQETVRYFPTFAVNVILVNEDKEFLLVKRKTNPAKGLYYLPGGRMLNGETVKSCGQRVLKDELGIKGEIKYISSEFAEEIWPTKNFGNDFGPYDRKTKNVHYLSTTIVAGLARGEKIKLDNESENYAWFRKIPEKPVLLSVCFGTSRNFLWRYYSIKI